MLPGQAVGVGRPVRAGALLVLRLPGLQTAERQRNRAGGAEAGGRVAQEPDRHRFVQVRPKPVRFVYTANYDLNLKTPNSAV